MTAWHILLKKSSSVFAALSFGPAVGALVLGPYELLS